MSNLIESNPQAALCGVGNFVGMCKPETVVDNGDGTVSFDIYTEGNSNDTVFKVKAKARCAEKKDAGSIVKQMSEAATKKGEGFFRLRTSGPIEVDIEENKLGSDKTLSVLQSVITVSPAHPNIAMEANQNNVFFMGRLIQTKFGGMELQFGHQSSAVEAEMSPAALPLTSGTGKKVSGSANKDVLVSGFLTRYTDLEGKDGYNASDKLSLAADSAVEIQMTAGRPRYKVNKNVQAVSVAGYEQGWDGEEKADPAAMKEMMAKMDF